MSGPSRGARKQAKGGAEARTQSKSPSPLPKNEKEEQTIISFEIDIANEKKNKDKTKLEINFHCKTQFGPWKFKKPYSEVWKFVTTLNKTYSKKELSKLASKQEKIEGEFLKGNNDKLIGYLKEIFTIVGNNKKIANDAAVLGFIEAKDENKNDIKNGKILTGIKEEDTHNEENEEKK